MMGQIRSRMFLQIVEDARGGGLTPGRAHHMDPIVPKDNNGP